jgi:hypothetical protein
MSVFHDKQLIVGFGHKRLRGKDTAAQFAVVHLEQALGPTRQESFAQSLKRGIGMGVFGLSQDQVYNEQLKAVEDPFWEMTPREILQRAGTEAMRKEFGRDIWIKTLQRRCLSDPANVVISDVRFVNEAEAIKSWGGVVIRIDRDVQFDARIDTHQSETDLDVWYDWDHTMQNDSTVDVLYRNTQALLDCILIDRMIGAVHG